MKIFTNLFRKSIILALVSALVLAALPSGIVSASGLKDPSNPPSEQSQLSNERLERLWRRLQHVYERQGRILDRADNLAERIQGLLDRASENGKDVTTLQAALEVFQNALKEAHPVYESAKGILNSHKGFDADGKVTDREQAIQTVKDLGIKEKDVRELVGQPGKALREAIKAFREANRPATEG